MTDLSLSRDDFSNKTIKYGLRIAVFKINFHFLPCDQIILRKLLQENFASIWKDHLEPAFLTPDFTFVIGTQPGEVNTYIHDQEVFLSSWRWDKENKSVYIYNLYSIWIIQFVLRQAMVLLLKGRGFFLHASAVIGKDQILRGFMAISGGGKSTTAASACRIGMKHVGDDMIIFVKDGEEWVCYGSRFLEKAFMPEDFEIKSYRLYEVHKSGKTAKSTEVKSYVERIRILMQQVWMYDAPPDEVDYALLLDFAKKTRVFKLYLPLNPNNLKEVLG